ncbi:MAG: TetR/AcrR family transcriptional regulator [Eggerthellaceae bacterium]
MDSNKRTDTLHRNNAEVNAITRERIEATLIALMSEKDFSDITITDITKKAGVSRLAYYRNYESKEDIWLRHLQQSLPRNKCHSDR